MERGLAATRPQAVARIEQGQVLVSGSVADKASRLVAPGEPIELLGPPPRFVSRGGEKLDAALSRFAIDVTGRRALDAGASHIAVFAAATETFSRRNLNRSLAEALAPVGDAAGAATARGKASPMAGKT